MNARHEWIEVGRAVRIEDEIARRGITLAGHGKHRCGPCPICGGTDRFAINIVKQLFNCRRCHIGGDVIELVKFLDGCGFNEAVETLTGADRPAQASRRPVERLIRAPVSIRPEAHDGRQQAAALWREAIPIEGTVAERYLVSPIVRGGRGLKLPEGVSDRVLRFHPACPFGLGVRPPCLVALWRSIVTDDPVAIHRIALTHDGRKIDRKALGPIGGAAIKLTDDAEVTYGLHVGEGIETVLAGIMLGLRPAWALGTAGAIAGFPVLAGLDALTILVDRDAAGMDAGIICSERWIAAGREVSCVISPDETANDINDLIKGNAHGV